MYLEKLEIRNFRCIENLDICFHNGLNILIGENNSGKTAIIDALRICFGYGEQKRDIYISKYDFFIDKTNMERDVPEIEFHLYFKIDNEDEAGIYRELLFVNEDTKNLQLHFKYYIGDNDRVKHKTWGGGHEGQQVSLEVLQLINSVHLDALRNAEQFLRPFRDSKLSKLYANIFIEDDRERDKEFKKTLVEQVKGVLTGVGWSRLIGSGKTKVNEHLKETTFGGKSQEIEISFTGFEFEEILNNLRIQIPVFDEILLDGDINNQKYFNIGQNGLGYNNLIYIATILGDIKQKKEVGPQAFFSLLIEEPEAHLHPQLQTLLFNYLNKLNKLNKEKQFQIFVSSHSPTITAKASLDSLIVLQSIKHKISALPLQNSNLDTNNKKFLHKFLDITKAQLFFSNGVVLVEGISEALLLPIFSKKVGAEYFLDNAGIEVVNINGVAFEHFAKLFNSNEDAKRLDNRCAIITDDDQDIEGNIPSRVQQARELEGGLLRVFQGQVTFEYMLFEKSEFNRNLLLSIYEEFHPNTVIDRGDSIQAYARNFVNKVKSQKGKSELAHRLAIRLENDPVSFEQFLIPEYIENAIKFVVKNE